MQENYYKKSKKDMKGHIENVLKMKYGVLKRTFKIVLKKKQKRS